MYKIAPFLQRWECGFSWTNLTKYVHSTENHKKAVRNQPFVAVKICKIPYHISHILPYTMAVFSGVTFCCEYCQIRNHTERSM